MLRAWPIGQRNESSDLPGGIGTLLDMSAIGAGQQLAA